MEKDGQVARANLPNVDIHSPTGKGHLGFAAPTRPDAVSLVFGALADPTRRTIVEALARSGAATATQLAGLFPVTRQAVTKHLAALADAGLVSTERVGREQRYHVAPEAMAEARKWMDSLPTDEIPDDQEP